MELMEAAKKRRSIRAYKANTTITKEQILDLIDCSRLAPSWKNSQTPRYYAITTPEKVAEIKSSCLPSFNASSCANAPALLVTAFEGKRAGFDREGNPDNELGDMWGAYDLGLANENILLKAAELGLDTLVMGIRDGEALRKSLDIPDSQIVVSVIALGYRENDAEMPKRKDVESIVKFY